MGQMGLKKKRGEGAGITNAKERERKEKDCGQWVKFCCSVRVRS